MHSTIFSKTPISIIRNVIELSLKEVKNGAEIYSILKKIYPVSQKHLNDILEHMRLVLAYYIKDCYAIERIAEENHNESISIDESLFTHENNSQVWVVGKINNITRKIRLEIVEKRSRNTMEKIINSHIPKDNIIISDAATCYSWLNEINSGYTHHVHSHGYGDFGENIDSTYSYRTIMA